MKFNVRTALLALLSAIALTMVLGASGGNTLAAPLPGFTAASGQAESDIQAIHVTNLLTRFRDAQIGPGTKEAIAIIVAICDGGVLNNTTASVISPLPGDPAPIAGGLQTFGCTPKPAATGGADGLATGIKGGVITFSGPGAKGIGTVRVYADAFTLPPFTGGGQGVLFRPGSLADTEPIQFDSKSGQAVAKFGRPQDWIMTTQDLRPVYAAGLGGETTPLLFYITADIAPDAPAGEVDVSLRLAAADDTQLGESGPCRRDLPVNCGSNFLTDNPVTNSFTIVGEAGTPSATPPPPPIPISGMVERLDPGWNLISSPVNNVSPDAIKGTCDFTSGPWDWTGSSYVQAATLSSAKGYWVKVDSPCTLQATGSPVRQELDLHLGWNLISSSRSWHEIGGRCDLQSGPWWYDGRQYVPVDTNEPLDNFKGYWIKVSDSCTLFAAALSNSPWADSLVPPGPPSLADNNLFTYLLNFLGFAPTIGATGQPERAATAFSVQAIRLSSLHSGLAELRVQGQGIAGTELQLFGLDGQLIIDERSAGKTLRFSPLDRSGQPLANGVYLYLVKIQGTNGQTLTSEIRKLVVLR
jgi:hypothetical protein